MSDPVPSELIAPPHQSNEPEGKVQKERASDAVARRLRSEPEEQVSRVGDY